MYGRQFIRLLCSVRAGRHQPRDNPVSASVGATIGDLYGHVPGMALPDTEPEFHAHCVPEIQLCPLLDLPPRPRELANATSACELWKGMSGSSQQPKYHGSCLCGAVEYELTGEPFTHLVCHCVNCQKVTGTAFASNVFFNKEVRVYVLISS